MASIERTSICLVEKRNKAVYLLQIFDGTQLFVFQHTCSLQILYTCRSLGSWIFGYCVQLTRRGARYFAGFKHVDVRTSPSYKSRPSGQIVPHKSFRTNRRFVSPSGNGCTHLRCHVHHRRCCVCSPSSPKGTCCAYAQHVPFGEEGEPSTCAPKVLYLRPLRGSQVRAREGDANTTRTNLLPKRSFGLVTPSVLCLLTFFPKGDVLRVRATPKVSQVRARTWRSKYNTFGAHSSAQIGDLFPLRDARTRNTSPSGKKVREGDAHNRCVLVQI